MAEWRFDPNHSTVTVNLEIEATKRVEGAEQTGRGGGRGRPH